MYQVYYIVPGIYQFCKLYRPVHAYILCPYILVPLAASAMHAMRHALSGLVAPSGVGLSGGCYNAGLTLKEWYLLAATCGRMASAWW